LKLHSLSTTISLPINQEFITILQDQHWEDTPLKLSDGESKTEHHIGLLLTHGMKDGETTDSSKSEEETTNVELKDKLLLVSQKLKLKLLPPNNDCYIEYQSSI